MLDQRVLDKLVNPGNAKIFYGLERIKKILSLLNNPQYNYKVIHITGTNGKGSTAAFIATGLIHAGYRVGKYTSPYINSINETISVNSSLITDQDLEVEFFKLEKILIQEQIELSPFEYLTAIMFDYFSQKNIDYLVLEVGMGGTNDATNVVNSIFSVITNISLEHTNYLGNSLSAIAEEKTGIIKNGKTIIADNTPELLSAVEQKTTNYINVLTKHTPKINLDKTNFITQVILAHNIYNLSLFGRFQSLNFLCAYEIFTDLKIAEESIAYAATHTIWPGRLQLISKNPLQILDATHNEAGAKALYESLVDFSPANEVVIITSILKDKNIDAMLNWFSKLADTVIYTPLSNNPRASDVQYLLWLGKGKFKQQYISANPENALALAKTLNKKMILITGSIYLLSHFNQLSI